MIGNKCGFPITDLRIRESRSSKIKQNLKKKNLPKTFEQHCPFIQIWFFLKTTNAPDSQVHFLHFVKGTVIKAGMTNERAGGAKERRNDTDRQTDRHNHRPVLPHQSPGCREAWQGKVQQKLKRLARKKEESQSGTSANGKQWDRRTSGRPTESGSRTTDCDVSGFHTSVRRWLPSICFLF